MSSLSEEMVAEVNAVTPMIVKLVPPGGRVLCLGPEDSELSTALAEISGEMISENAPEGVDCVVVPFVLQDLVEEDVYTALIENVHECLKPGGWMVVIDKEEVLDPSDVIVGQHPRGGLRVLDAAPWLGSKVHPCDYPDHWLAAFLKKPSDLPVDDAPVFYRQGDGVHAVTIPMPETIAVARKLLDGHPSSKDSPPFERKGDLIDFSMANGRWVYKIVGWGRYGEAIATLESSE